MTDPTPTALRYDATYAATRPGCVVRTMIDGEPLTLTPPQALALADKLERQMTGNFDDIPYPPDYGAPHDMTTEPTGQRIEAAWRAIRMDKDNWNCGVDPCDEEEDGYESCPCWRQARAALTADAPFAASEYARGRADGLREARKIVDKMPIEENQSDAKQWLLSARRLLCGWEEGDEVVTPRKKRRLCLLLIVNDLFMALNLYSWWFYGDSFCGFAALFGFMILIIFAFIQAKTRPTPSAKS